MTISKKFTAIVTAFFAAFAAPAIAADPTPAMLAEYGAVYAPPAAECGKTLQLSELKVTTPRCPSGQRVVPVLPDFAGEEAVVAAFVRMWRAGFGLVTHNLSAEGCFLAKGVAFGQYGGTPLLAYQSGVLWVDNRISGYPYGNADGATLVGVAVWPGACPEELERFGVPIKEVMINDSLGQF